MRIISKHHDYYDSARAYGQDTDVVYVREWKETTVQALSGLKEIPLPEAARYWMVADPLTNTERGIVGFYDRIYRFLDLDVYTRDHGSAEERANRQVL